MMSIKYEIDAYYYSVATLSQTELIRNSLIQLCFIINCLIATLMTFFLKFHILLVTTNKTTIENLDKKGRTYKSIYDVGAEYNWSQVFGTNKLLWPFPAFMGSGKPLGDGIYWPTN